VSGIRLDRFHPFFHPWLTVMARSKWTLMLVPHDNERVRSVQLSSSAVRVVLSSVLFLAVLSGTFTVGFFIKQNQYMRAQRLQHENVLLAAEVTQMRGRMTHLSASLDSLASKDEKYRVIAGLTPLDADVQRVGIGGPGTATPQSNPVYALDQATGEKLFAADYDLATLTRRAKLLRTSMDEAIHALKKNTERLEAIPSIAPADGPLSSLFSRARRNPVLHITRPHKGIDIAAPIGEPILAPAKGVVTFAGMRSGGYGRMVEIDHGFGYVTRFAHCSRILVHKGQTVERGEVIAEVGESGLATGPHLHYEVEVNGKQVDPLNFIISDVIPD
jgi:murein DD-endopeptidase MepM/ murein hydrolase activator NlpD